PAAQTAGSTTGHSQNDEDPAAAIADDLDTAGDDEASGGAAVESYPDGLDGVVVFFTEEDSVRCIPLCTINTDPAADPEGDDWSSESDHSCVIPDTNTGSNQACVTGEEIPEESSVPGV